MQRYKILLSIPAPVAVEPHQDGLWVRYEDAAEQAKKARREALEEVVSAANKYNWLTLDDLSMLCRQLMEEEG